MKFCPECGTKLMSEKVKFCFECGCKLTGYFENDPQEETKKTPESTSDFQAEETWEEVEVAPETEPEETQCILPLESDELMMEETEELEETEFDEEETEFGEEETEFEEEETEFEEVEEALLEELFAEAQPKGIPCFEIPTTYKKQDFLRAAWIQLARENPPEDVFALNFSEVSVISHQVFEQDARMLIKYQADIGVDRQESYTELETYYVDVPYTITELKYNRQTNRKEPVLVTKHRKEERQRMVKKYRTVTDWRPLSRETTLNSTVLVENLSGRELDSQLFSNTCLSEKVKGSMKAVKSIPLEKSTRETTTQCHYENAGAYVFSILPGDHARDVDFRITESVSIEGKMYLVDEYSTSISYKGKTYKKRAFPVGEMPISGDSIPNDLSPKQIAKVKKQEIKEEYEYEKTRIQHTAWERGRGLSIPATLSLLLTIVLSIFVRVPIVLILSFALSTTLYFASNSRFKKLRETIANEIENRFHAKREELETEMANYETTYRMKMLTKLPTR